MEPDFTKHHEFNNDGVEKITAETLEPQKRDSIVPARFTFDNERSNELGGVNYVFSDEAEGDIIRVSIRDTSLFSASFYANSKSEGRSRARSFRKADELKPIAKEIKTDIFG